MTAHDIVRIAITVAITQLGCDLLANRFIFSKESYRHAVTALNRAQTKLAKAAATEEKQTAKAQEKQAKKLQRAQAEAAEASAEVAKRHMAPSFWTSIIFVMLHRILGLEYKGKVLAVLPFVPFKLLRRLTQWGGLKQELEAMEGWSSGGITDVNQACGFLFIYLLCTMSVKFVMHEWVGVSPPKGADRGVMTMMESPKSQRLLKAYGLDMDELKTQ